MQVYLPIAELSVSAEVVLALGAVVGFLSGVFGVGGGFLATPFLIFLGVPPAIAVGTQANQLVAASLSGVLGHFSRGNVDMRIGGVMLAGSLVGSVAGIALFKVLLHFGHIDATINILYTVLLGSIGLLMALESVRSVLKKGASSERAESKRFAPLFEKLPYKMHFPKSKLFISALVPAGIGCLGGLLVSIMGIGGGFFLVPAMIYLLGMPTLLAAGTSLFQIVFTTAFTTVLHAMANKNIDLVLAVLLIIGGVIGVQLGVRVARFIKGAQARFVLAFLMIIVSFKLGSDMLIRPLELYSTVVR